MLSDYHIQSLSVLFGIDHLAIYKTGDNRQIDAKQLRLTVFRYHIVRIVYQGIFQRLIIPIGVWKHSDCSQMVVKVMLFASQILYQISHHRLIGFKAFQVVLLLSYGSLLSQNDDIRENDHNCKA